MKKILLATVILAATAGAANAAVNVDIGIGQPAYAPAYIAPAPNVVYYNEHHHNYDWNYWHPRPVVVERRTYVDYDRDDRRWDRDHDRGHGKGRGHDRH